MLISGRADLLGAQQIEATDVYHALVRDEEIVLEHWPGQRLAPFHLLRLAGAK